MSALAGLGLMLSDDGYRRVFSASQKAIYWSAPVSSLSEMIKSALRCLRGEMPGYLLTASGIWAVLMAFALFDTERKNGSSGAASAVCLGIGFYFLLRPAFQPALLSPTLLLWLDFLMMVIYYSLVAWNLWQHGRIVGNWFPLWTLGYFVLITAPLFVAKPLSERVFMPAYTVQITLLCECLPRSTRSKRSIFALAAVFIALYSFLFTVYGEIHKIDRARVAYAQRRLTDGERVTMIPKLPHEDYVVVSYPYSGWVGRFTRFYEIEGKMDISVCELEEWLDLPDTPNF